MKKSTIKKIKTNLFVYSLIWYPLVLFIIFYVVVNINSIVLAFQKVDGTGKTFAGFENFRAFWNEMFDGNSVLWRSFVNSLLMYIINLVICMPLYIFFSYLIYKKCPGNKIISFLMMIPAMMSGLVIALVFINFAGSDGPLTYILKKLGIDGGKWVNLFYSEDRAFGTTLFYTIWTSFSTSMIVYPTAMRQINPEIIESARIDGATNMFQELRYIILPLIYPTMTTFLITGFACIFTATGPILEFYYTDAPDYVSNIGYYFTKMILVDSSEASYPKYAAGSLILTCMIAPLTLLLKYLLEKFGPKTE